MAPHSSTLAWKIPWMEEPCRLQSMGSLRVGHDSVTSLSLFTFMHWRRKWQPTPVFLPGESQGRGSLMGCHLWGRTELDTTEVTQQQLYSCFSPEQISEQWLSVQCWLTSVLGPGAIDLDLLVEQLVGTGNSSSSPWLTCSCVEHSNPRSVKRRSGLQCSEALNPMSVFR